MIDDEQIMDELGGDDDAIEEDDELGEDGLPKKESPDGGIEEEESDLEV